MICRKCDVCGKVEEGEHPKGWGGFVTTEGEKDACGGECMLKGLSSKTICTLGTLETIKTAEEALGHPIDEKGSRPS